MKMGFVTSNPLLVVFSILTGTHALDFDPVAQQLYLYKQYHQNKVGVLTTSNGNPVDYKRAGSTLDYESLINQEYFMDYMTHFDRERIPERVVHAKGAGAFGYFEVTHDITKICKSKFLNAVGKKTKIFVRFSSVAGQTGSSDAARDNRGFAVKFYTEDGNFDFVGINFPMFVIKDPILFPTFAHARKKNPVTNVFDDNSVWDFLTLNPESMFLFLNIFTDRGTPYSYRTMPGFSIHTYQLVNNNGDYYYARFSFLPDLGIKNLTADEAINVGGKDADHLTRDLYRAIGRGEFPSWILYLQILTLDDVKKSPFDVFDVTRILPSDKYPLTPVGRIVLNKNPDNYFADVEQAAFCPGNVVDGIDGAPDHLFQARRFAYRDSQFHRLGGNFRKIPINCPITYVFTYLRDSLPPVNKNDGSAPNYYPNSFNGPSPYCDKTQSRLIKIQENQAYNIDQAAEFVNNMSDEDLNILAKNILYSLSTTYNFLQVKAVKLLSTISPKLGEIIEYSLRTNKTLSYH